MEKLFKPSSHDRPIKILRAVDAEMLTVIRRCPLREVSFTRVVHIVYAIYTIYKLLQHTAKCSMYSRPRKICSSVWRKSGSCGPAGRSGPLLRWCSTPACGMHGKSCSCPAAGAWAEASVRRRTRTCSTSWCRLPVRAENQSTDYIRARE